MPVKAVPKLHTHSRKKVLSKIALIIHFWQDFKHWVKSKDLGLYIQNILKLVNKGTNKMITGCSNIIWLLIIQGFSIAKTLLTVLCSDEIKALNFKAFTNLSKLKNLKRGRMHWDNPHLHSLNESIFIQRVRQVPLIAKNQNWNACKLWLV